MGDDPKSYVLHASAGVFSMMTGCAAITVRGPMPKDHPFFLHVGRVASEWSHFEHALDLTIWALLGGDSRFAACVTSQILGVGPRCKAIGSLGMATGINPKTLKEYRSLVSNSYTVADERARIVHDPWYSEQTTQEPSQFKAMPYSDPRLGLVEVTEDEIEHLIEKISALKDRAYDLHNAVATELAALRKTPP